MSSKSMHMRNLVKIHQNFPKILSRNERYGRTDTTSILRRSILWLVIFCISPAKFSHKMGIKNFQMPVNDTMIFQYPFICCILSRRLNQNMPFQGSTSVVVRVPYSTSVVLWFLTVTCSCCPYLYFGSAIMLVKYFVNFR